MTNPFRPCRPASLRGSGEARKACRAEGLCVKATAGAAWWLGTECSEGQTRETGRSTRNKPVFIVRDGGPSGRQPQGGCEEPPRGSQSVRRSVDAG